MISFSCGGIIIFSQDQKHVILCATEAGHLSFTKGGPKNQETLRQTAVREAWEESGISVEQLLFEPTTWQQPLQEVNEDRGTTVSVQYYIATYVENDLPELKFDTEELKSVTWYSVEEALQSKHLLQRRKAILQHACVLLTPMKSNNNSTMIRGTDFFDNDNSQMHRGNNKPKQRQQSRVQHKPQVNNEQGRKQKNMDLSKTLSWILRHGAGELHLTMDDSGYIKLSDVLQLEQLNRVTREQILKVVQQNDKQRFHLMINAAGVEMIRANQGHSMVLGQQIDDDKLLTLLSAPLEKCLHGTTEEAWRSIESQGLNRMQRTHIHFTTIEPTEANRGVVKSGARMSSQVWIYIDMANAMTAGIKFYRSQNDVILSPGNEDGILLPEFFTQIIHL